MKHLIYLLIFPLIIIFSNSYALDSLNIRKMYETSNPNTSGIGILKCDTNNCVAIFTNGVGVRLFKTTDGGFNWNLIIDDGMFTSKLRSPYGWAATSPDSIIVTFGNDTMQRTTNGGITWDTINTINIIEDLRFLKNGIGIGIIGDCIARTTDFGLTWSRLAQIPNIDEIHAPIIFNDSTFGCFGYRQDTTYDYYCYSIDYGKTWIQYEFFANQSSIEYSFFIDSLKGWAIGMETNNPNKNWNNVIIHTNDGGKTWVIQLDSMVEPKSPIQSISFVDSLHGLVTGGNKILTTSDGGLTWVLDTNTIIHDFYNHPEVGIFSTYLTQKKFLIVTWTGKIFMYNEDGFNDVKNEETINENIPLNIYPNPAITELNINLSSNTYPPLSYQITDLLGKTLQFGFFKDEDFINTLKINVEKLKTGVYFINLIYADRKESGKFVKE